MIIMGSSTLIGGVLTLLFLPETVGVPLVDTIEDIERLKDNDKSIWKCLSPKELNRRLEKANEKQNSNSLT